MTSYIKLDNQGGFQLKEINYDPQLTKTEDKHLMLEALYQATNLLEDPEVSMVKQSLIKATQQTIKPKPVLTLIECNTNDKDYILESINKLSTSSPDSPKP